MEIRAQSDLLIISDNDFVSPGATSAHIGRGVGQDHWNTGHTNLGTNGFGQIAQRQHPAFADPEDEGNMGIAFKWYNEEMNHTEFGFYAMRYTSRLPSISGFQGAQDPTVLGAVQAVGGLATALNPAVAFNTLPAATQQSLNDAYQAARAGAWPKHAPARRAFSYRPIIAAAGHRQNQQVRPRPRPHQGALQSRLDYAPLSARAG